MSRTIDDRFAAPVAAYLATEAEWVADPDNDDLARAFCGATDRLIEVILAAQGEGEMIAITPVRHLEALGAIRVESRTFVVVGEPTTSGYENRQLVVIPAAMLA